MIEPRVTRPGITRLPAPALAVVVALAAIVGCLWAGPAGAAQPLRVVDFPTAGLYARGEYGFDMDLYGDGGLLFGVGVGIARFVSFGMSYGGIKFIGSGNPHMNPRPEVNIRVRVLEEGVDLPAIALGFDSQGYGRFFDDKDKYGEERYLVKSRGIYAVASKNWDVLGPFSLHGGISYSLENEIDNDPTIYLGLIKTFQETAEIALEMDLGINDTRGHDSIVERRPYLNASVAWQVTDDFSLAFKVRDIVTKEKDGEADERKWNRGFCLSYRAQL